MTITNKFVKTTAIATAIISPLVKIKTFTMTVIIIPIIQVA